MKSEASAEVPETCSLSNGQQRATPLLAERRPEEFIVFVTTAVISIVHTPVPAALVLYQARLHQGSGCPCPPLPPALPPTAGRCRSLDWAPRLSPELWGPTRASSGAGTSPGLWMQREEIKKRSGTIKLSPHSCTLWYWNPTKSRLSFNRETRSAAQRFMHVIVWACVCVCEHCLRNLSRSSSICRPDSRCSMHRFVANFQPPSAKDCFINLLQLSGGIPARSYCAAVSVLTVCLEPVVFVWASLHRAAHFHTFLIEVPQSFPISVFPIWSPLLLFHSRLLRRCFLDLQWIFGKEETLVLSHLLFLFHQQRILNRNTTCRRTEDHPLIHLKDFILYIDAAHPQFCSSCSVSAAPSAELWRCSLFSALPSLKMLAHHIFLSPLTPPRLLSVLPPVLHSLLSCLLGLCLYDDSDSSSVSSRRSLWTLAAAWSSLSVDAPPPSLDVLPHPPHRFPLWFGRDEERRWRTGLGCAWDCADETKWKKRKVYLVETSPIESWSGPEVKTIYIYIYE